jgi:hypothetical protein
MESYLSDLETKLTVMKSLRVSEPLLRLLTRECKARKTDFSDYIRQAAVAYAAKEQNSSNPKAAA